MNKRILHTEYLERVKNKNIHFKNNKFKIIGNYTKMADKILVETEFGKLNMCAYSLLDGRMPTIQSAINKNEYFINQSIKIHNNKYNYSKINYINNSTKIIIKCPIHDDFEQLPSAHLSGNGCNKCGIETTRSKRLSNNEEFIIKANKIHNEKYDYSKIKYINSITPITIICKLHGEFFINPITHLSKTGCPICSKLKRTEIASNYLNGWNPKTWEISAKQSKNFDSYKVYLIHCKNNDEEFYKIGRTFRSIEKRFNGLDQMPYDYKVIKEISFKTALETFNFERDMKRKFKNNKYIPQIHFNGKQECFTQINTREFRYE